VTPVSSLCPMCEAARAKILTEKTFDGRTYYLVHCRRCDLHFCAPTPTAHEITQFYSGDYHAELRVPGASEKAFGAKFVRYRDYALEFVKNGRSLDIGTATGLLPSILKASGFEAEGLESNRASAEWGEAHYGIKISTCRLSEIVAGPGTYDLISMTDVLEHTEHPLQFLQMVRNYLRPGGCLLVTFPDIRSAESLYLHFWASMLRRSWIWSSCHIPYHVWEFTPATARMTFDKAGFDVLAFRRSQEKPESIGGVPGLFRLPLRLLSLRPLCTLAGTQMEFMIRRRI
jgi:2-polyprenyl-3-methyl-5-hydroxy-6-metoxy-1,4-benzoquinol methylase